MLVFWNQRLVYFAVPKTATFSVEYQLAEDAAIVMRDPPAMKHMPAYTYENLLKPQFDKIGGANMETVAVMREPLDWLGSWYRYRARDEIRGRKNSTASISFEAFVEAYMEPERPAFANVGSQSQFLSGRGDRIFIDYLFPFEDMAALEAFFARRLGREVSFRHRNRSPKMELALTAATRSRLEKFSERDFRLYERVASGAMAAI